MAIEFIQAIAETNYECGCKKFRVTTKRFRRSGTVLVHGSGLGSNVI